MIDAKAYKELEAVVGPENISEEPAICDSYAVQPFHRPDTGKWIPRPAAVILPGSTEEVSAIVKIFNKYKIKYKPHSTGFGAEAGPGVDGVVQVDLRRMNKIIEVDEKNMIIVVEPYVSQMEIQMEARKRGLNFMMNSAGPQTSALASVTSHQGSGDTSCSMGYNGRNLLACEWVSPTGEIVKIGSVESGAGWISADGPGPSMKGIVRGYFGYDGGLGIFTKAAIKLYHWAGPKELQFKNDGQLFDIDMDFPENIHYYTLLFPGWEEAKDAFYRICENELAFVICKLPGVLSGWVYLYERMPEIVKHPILKKVLGVTQHRTHLIIVGNTPREMEYKVACLKQIMKESKGIMIGGRPVNQYDMGMAMGQILETEKLFYFNGPGSFNVTMGADESIDIICRQGMEAAEVKLKLISEGRALDDMGDGSWTCLYEQGTWGHVEGVMLLDSQNPIDASAMMDYSIQCSQRQVTKRLGGTGFAMFGGKAAIDILSPACYNYFDYVEQIKKIWDPDDLANITLT